jgi:hypothetical protein
MLPCNHFDVSTLTFHLKILLTPAVTRGILLILRKLESFFIFYKIPRARGCPDCLDQATTDLGEKWPHHP